MYTPCPMVVANDLWDDSLLSALRRGDDAAFERLVRGHAPRMLTVARRYLPEEGARDAVQEAFVSAFKAIARFDGRSRLASWLHRIVVNHCLMQLRAARRRPADSIDDLLPRFLEDGHRANPGPAWPPDAEAQLLVGELRGTVRRAIDRLPESYRQVLLLRDIEELTGAETAEMLGITVGAVKVRLHRARMALRELLDREIGGMAS